MYAIRRGIPGFLDEISSDGNSAALCAIYLLEWQKLEIKYVSVEALHK